MRVIVRLPGESAVSHVTLSLETIDLLSSILQAPLTAPVAQDLLHGLIKKTEDQYPFLNDAEIALVDEASSQLEQVDFSSVIESLDAWSEAHAKLVEPAQKGLAFSSRAVRAMFQARTQEDFEAKIARFVELIPESMRVDALEFAAELLEELEQVVRTEGREWDIQNHDYIDNHVYQQLYLELVAPHLESRGKALCERRVRILKDLVKTFQF